MEELGLRRAELQNLITDGAGRVRLEFIVPARGLIGFRSQFPADLGLGTTHALITMGQLPNRNQPAITGAGIDGIRKTLAYALFSLQERGRLFIEPNVDVYEADHGAA